MLALIAALPLVLAQAPVRDVTAEAGSDGVRVVAQSSSGLREQVALVPVGAVKDLLRHGELVYASLVAGGLVVVDLATPTSPVVTERLLEGKKVVRIDHLGEGTLVLALEDSNTATLSLADPRHPAEIRFVAGRPTLGTIATKVVAVDDGAVVIGAGSRAGFYVGETVRLRSKTRLSASDQLAEQQGLSSLGAVTAVVVLSRVDEERALAVLGRGEVAAVGDDVEVTNEAPASPVFPRSAPYNWRVQASVRPFVDLSGQARAVGFLGEALVQYYFTNLPLRLEVSLEPLGLAVSTVTQHNPMSAIVDIAFTEPFFEIGIGTGISTLANEIVCEALMPCASNQAIDPLLVLTGQLGAIDGLNVVATYGVASTHAGFDFSRVGELQFNAPLTRRLTLYTQGGAGTGYDYWELGLRTAFHGLGGAGSWIFSGGVGTVFLTDSQSDQPGGIAFSLGVETRL